MTLTAIPFEGFVFSGWGTICNRKEPCTLTLDEPMGMGFSISFYKPTPLFFEDPFFFRGEEGVAYHGSLGIRGGVPPYRPDVIEGSLPSGLRLDSNGFISGTPIFPKKSSFTVRVRDDEGESADKRFQMKIFKALHIATKTIKEGRVGRKYLARLTATGGEKSYYWSLVSGNLSASGLNLDSFSGTISGIPTTSGSFNLTLQVIDPLGGSITKDFTLVVHPQ